MLFAYNDDGRLEVVADENEARHNFDPTDVEDGVIRFFDGDGKPLAPRFTRRSEKKFLGVSLRGEPGGFDLVPAPDGEEALGEALGPMVVLMPNPWFSDVDAVRTHLHQAPGARRA